MKKTISVRMLSAAVVLAATLAPIAARAQSDVFTSVNNGGSNTSGAIYQYSPGGTQSTFASGLAEPRGLSFDSSGNLFVATSTLSSGTFSGALVKFTSGGTKSTFSTAFPTNSFLEGTAINKAGDIFVVALDFNNPSVLPGTIYEFTPGGTESTFGSTPSETFGLAFDKLGNLYAADFVDRTIYEFTPGGVRSVFAGPAAFGSTGPAGLAFDSTGNLFVSTDNLLENNTDTILEFTPGAVETTFATGLNDPRGLAFDNLGNLFAANNIFAASGDILEFTPGGTQSTFATGIPGPEFLATRSVPDSGTTLGLLAISTFGLLFARKMVKV